jgi:hypothetical protein
MQLFLDIDGVLLDFERSFVAWLNAKYSMGLPEDYQANNWDFTDILDAAELDRRWRLYLASPEAGHMTPLIDPPRFNTLADAHDVHLVTNFPLPHWEKRVRNLDELGLRYTSLSHCGFLIFDESHKPKSKSQIVQELRSATAPALFLDDHPDNCLDVARNCPDVEVWLMSRRFNRAFAHPSVHRADTWDHVIERVNGEELRSVKAAG